MTIAVDLGRKATKQTNCRHWTVVRVRLFSDIGHVKTKIDWEEPTEIKTCMYTVGA